MSQGLIYDSLANDILLYLALWGPKAFTFGRSRIPLSLAFAKSEFRKKNYGTSLVHNLNVNSVSGKDQEYLLAASLCLASHRKGFSGMDFKSYLEEVCFELQQCDETANFIEVKPVKFIIDCMGIDKKVSYMLPNDLAAPTEFSNLVSINGGEISQSSRPKDGEQMDFISTYSGNSSNPCAESKESHVDGGIIADILPKVPSTCDLFFVLAKSLSQKFESERLAKQIEAMNKENFVVLRLETTDYINMDTDEAREIHLEVFSF